MPETWWIANEYKFTLSGVDFRADSLPVLDDHQLAT
jgi:hypothetical protein